MKRLYLKKTTSLLGVLLLFFFAVSAQNPKEKFNQKPVMPPGLKAYNKNSGQVKTKIPEVPDDPEARFAFELLRTKDPKTGMLPTNIRQRELEFARRRHSHMDIPLAAGDISTQWFNRGPKNVGGRTRALAVDVDSEDIILGGGVSGGMWRSTDGGISWSKTTGSNELQSVSAIAQDTRAGSTSTWYYATGEVRGNSAGSAGAPYSGDGIYKSSNGGQTWSLLASTSTNVPEFFDHDFDYNHELVVNPTNGDLLVANAGGIYRSGDGGVSFTNTLDNTSGGIWSDVIVSSVGVFYAAIELDGVFQSSDGINWTEITPVGMPLGSNDRMELALSASNENIVYALGQDSGAGENEHTLWKFADNTDTWTDLSANLPSLGGHTGTFNSQGGYDLLIKVKPEDEYFVIIGGRNLWRSTDGFSSSNNTSWIGGYTPANNSFALYTDHHPDQHSFVFLSNNQALSGSDGGVHHTADITTSLDFEAVDWTSLNNGYLTTQVYAVSVGPGNQIMAGFQDNGTWLTVSTDPDNDWSFPFSGDGAYSAFNSDGTVRYVSSQFGNIFRFNYSDANDQFLDAFAAFEPDTYSSSLFIAPFYLDPADNDLFYLGGDVDLFVNVEASVGSSSFGWKSISLGNVGAISEIGVSGNNLIYVGTSAGEVFRITGPGDETPEIVNVNDENLPNGYVSGLGVNPFRPNEVLLCFSNYSIPSVFYTNDSGTTWTDVSGNLEENGDGSGSGPSVRISRILGDGDRYFVGTSTGLYSTTALNGASTVWTQENSGGIGDVVVEHLVTRETDGLVVAGSHGNGVFSAEFEVSKEFDNDLGITAIPSPSSGILTNTESVKATVVNLGNNIQNSFSLTLFVDDVLVVTDNVNTPVGAGESYEHTFSLTHDFSAIASFLIRVELTLAGDENVANNELTKEIENIEGISTFPYSESFEGTDHGWESETLWELGTPEKTQLSGASDGVKAWATGLVDNYPVGSNARLLSPVFDFSGLVQPIISFDLNYQIEETYDGLVLAYRTDLSSDFTLVPQEWGISNWYDQGNFSFLNEPAWSGTTNGAYVAVSASLPDLAGAPIVQLALVFASDGSVNDEGAAMDHIEIEGTLNQPPLFSLGDDISVDEDAGQQLFAVYAKDISDGDGGHQTLDFEIKNDNSGLFSQQPSIAISGDLSFTSAPDLSGSANVTVTLSDDGGTPDPEDDDKSTEKVFKINVNPVNDPPLLAKTFSDLTFEDSDNTVSLTLKDFFTDIDDETLSFSLTNSNTSVASASIDDNGILTITKTGPGEATVTVTASDQAGDAVGDTFIVTVIESGNVTGLEIDWLGELKIYPNPADDRLNIDYTNLGINTRFAVYDMGGELVGDVSNSNSNGSLSFDLKSFPNGIYLLTIQNDGESAVFRIIKN